MIERFHVLPLALALVCGPLVADCTCEFSGGGEALYWKPVSSGYSFGSTLTVGTDRRTIDFKRQPPTYDWGFRVYVGAAIRECPTFGTLDWTHYRGTSTLRLIGESVESPLFTPLDDLIVRRRAEYDKINLRVGRPLARYFDSHFHAYGGVRYVKIQEERVLLALPATPTSLSSREKARFRGAGFEVGVGGRMHLGSPLALVVKMGITGSIGETTNALSSFNTADVVNVNVNQKTASRTIWVPGVDFRLGLSYAISCKTWAIGAEVGYQLDYYFEPLLLFDGRSVNEQSRAATQANIGFGGPYAGLFISF